MRNLDIGIGEDKFPERSVEGEDVDSGADGEAEEGRGRVEAVPGGHEVLPGLQGVHQTLLREPASFIKINLALGVRIGYI